MEDTRTRLWNASVREYSRKNNRRCVKKNWQYTIPNITPAEKNEIGKMFMIKVEEHEEFLYQYFQE